MAVGVVLLSVGAGLIAEPGTGMVTAGALLIGLALLVGWRT
jgi:hypothetical protein